MSSSPFFNYSELGKLTYTLLMLIRALNCFITYRSSVSTQNRRRARRALSGRILPHVSTSVRFLVHRASYGSYKATPTIARRFRAFTEPLHVFSDAPPSPCTWTTFLGRLPRRQPPL